VRIRDIAKENKFQYPEYADKEGIRSVLCLPLSYRERVLGVLRVYSGNVRDFTEEEAGLMKIFAVQAGNVIKNTKMYGRIKSLNIIGKNITSQLSIEKVLSNICRYAVSDMEAKGASIILLSGKTGNLEAAASFGLSENFILKGMSADDKSVTECMEGREVVIENAAEDPRIEYPEEFRKEEINSIICVPLKFKDRIMGMLRIYTAYEYTMDSEDMEFLNILADFGVVAIENARLYEHVKRDYEDLSKDVWKWYGWGERQPEI
jgi:GAF domain-containing protein